MPDPEKGEDEDRRYHYDDFHSKHITPRLWENQDMAVSVEYLRNLLSCDAESGVLHWKCRPEAEFADSRSAKSWNTQYAGKPALTYVDKNGYCVGNIWGKPYKAHRVIWAIVNGEWPEDEIDHINRNRSDNRVANLRHVTRAQNSQNIGRRSDNTSGLSGIARHQRGWRLRVNVQNRTHDFGTFSCFAKAVSARTRTYKSLGFSDTHGTQGAGH